MYAVNYRGNGGFVIVGASRKYAPILAYSDSGFFPADYSDSGIDVWIEEQKLIIDYHETANEESVSYSSLWREYERQTDPKTSVTKSGDPLIPFVPNSIAAWEAQGYIVHPLGDCPDGLPQEVYEGYCDIAEGVANPNYDYMANSFILEERNNDYTIVDPLIHTVWHQSAPYNCRIPYIGDIPPYAGCGAIALSQIMRYHEWPSDRAWNMMPTEFSDPDFFIELQDFIYEVGVAIGTDYSPQGSPCDIDDIYTALTNTYDYSATLTDHSKFSVAASLLNNCPVLMRGARSLTLGHYWVCDAYLAHQFSQSFSLRVISVVSPLQFENAGTQYESFSPGVEYFRMVWGRRNAEGNGYFIDSNIGFMGNGEWKDYKYKRKDIVNITPINN